MNTHCIVDQGVEPRTVEAPCHVKLLNVRTNDRLTVRIAKTERPGALYIAMEGKTEGEVVTVETLPEVSQQFLIEKILDY